MSGVTWGAFFRDQGMSEYLVDIYDDEDEARKGARWYDEEAFEKAMFDAARVAEEGHEEPARQGFEGMHYVEPVSSALVGEVHEDLARGFAVKILRE